MKALVIGRGSMGKRRIRDLTKLGVDVVSWDVTDGTPLVIQPPCLLIVSTPPGQHAEHVPADGAIELPTFTEADVEFVPRPHFPSCTPLFCADIINITRTENPRPLAYTLHVGQHIDDWHPGADPATYYAYRDETSPTRELLPFELIWLTRWLGPVRDACGFRTFEVGHTAVRHESGAIGTIIIDTIARPAVRRFTASGMGWARTWDIRYTEDAYLAEMRAFVASVKGDAVWPYTASDEAANLEVLRTIERGG